MEKLFIISNESIFNYEGKFFCDNIDMKSTPEGLKNKFEVNIIARKSKKVRSHKINLKNIRIYGNIFSFLLRIFRTTKKDNTKYLIISISPFTTLACILLFLLKKKTNVYLRSDGYEEYKSILGFFGPAIYHIMFSLVGKISNFISCREHILRGRKGHIVEPSQITDKWLLNKKETSLNKIKLLYVGRIKIEKGIFSLINLIKDCNNLSLIIVGAEKNFKKKSIGKNIFINEIEIDKRKLINYYDSHQIFILPSYTEGHPMSLLEALGRNRPVIIFTEIEHVIEERKGIFVSKRNKEDLLKTIEHIKKNYKEIQAAISNNNLPTKEKFLKDMSNILIK